MSQIFKMPWRQLRLSMIKTAIKLVLCLDKKEPMWSLMPLVIAWKMLLSQQKTGLSTKIVVSMFNVFSWRLCLWDTLVVVQPLRNNWLRMPFWLKSRQWHVRRLPLLVCLRDLKFTIPLTISKMRPTVETQSLPTWLMTRSWARLTLTVLLE